MGTCVNTKHFGAAALAHTSARRLRRRRRWQRAGPHARAAASPAGRWLAGRPHGLQQRGRCLAGQRARSRGRHAAQPRAGRPAGGLHRHRRPPHRPRTRRRAARPGQVLLRGLHAQRRQPRHAPRHLLLQRRPRLGQRVAAPGLLRPQAPRHRRAQHHRARKTSPSSTTPTPCCRRPTSSSSTPSAPGARRPSRPSATAASGAWTPTPPCFATSCAATST